MTQLSMDFAGQLRTAADAQHVLSAVSTPEEAACALSGQEKRSGGHLDPITATRATAGQFGHPADGGLIEREEAVHALKIDVQPMTDLLSGDKTGEVRRDDRGFSVGDTVNLTCADGRTATRRITHIQRGYGLPDDLCVLSYASATPAAQPLLPGAQVGSEPGIPAAQPAQRVKPLVWGDDGVAEALGLRYILSDPSYSYTGGWEVLEETTNTPMPDTDGSAEDAKAAAQADYERRILSALEPAAQDGAEVAMAECQAFSAGYEAGEKATAGGEELAKLRTEVERLRDLVGKNTDASLRVAERKDAEIARLRAALKAEVERLREALALAANRLRSCAIDYDAGSRKFIETGEWADEASAALRAEQKGDA